MTNKKSIMVSKLQANPFCATWISFIKFPILANLIDDCTATIVAQQVSVKILIAARI